MPNGKWENTPEQCELLMAHYNLSDEQFDGLDAKVIHALWEAIREKGEV